MNKANILIIIIMLLLTSCEKQIRNDKLEKKEIELNDHVEEKNKSTPKKRDEVKSIETVLDTDTLYPNKLAVSKKDLNLDLDNENEQFIVLIDENKNITFVVADFNQITRDYFPAWQVELPLIYNSDFTISEQDVLGVNQNLELVLTGQTKKSSKALYLFKKTAPPKGLHIYYKNIYSYNEEGSASLVTKSRDLDYVEAKKNQGKAYDILVEKTNIINENTINLITENWAWDRRRNKFFKESFTSTEEKVNVKEKLRAVYKSSKSDFIKYISGEWHLPGSDNSEDKIIIIDHKTETISFKYIDGFEQYRIKSSWRGYQYITFSLRNLEVSPIPLLLSFTLKSTDKIVVSYKTPTFWDGEYTRLNNEDKVNLISKTNTDIKREPSFTGVFKNVSHSLNFSYPEYKKTNLNNNTVEEGTFSVLKLTNGDYILQLQTKSEERSLFKVTNYKLNYNEQKLTSQTIRTLKIHEGVLTTHGIELKPDTEAIKFEQTEVLDID